MGGPTVVMDQTRSASSSPPRQQLRAPAVTPLAREKTEHLIHKKDGTIGERNSYGNDPYPPRLKAEMSRARCLARMRQVEETFAGPRGFGASDKTYPVVLDCTSP